MKVRLTVLAVLLAGCTLAGLSAPIQVLAELVVTELAPAGALAELFAFYTGHSANPISFGVYAVEPIGERLYLGVGAGWPAGYTGALLARYDGVLTPLYSLPEQGFIDMQAVGDQLYIPGADPLADWSLGNIYIHTISTGETIQRRTLPNVLHTLGLWHDGGRIYVAVGRLGANGLSYSGGILWSDDDGLSWDENWTPKLGKFRTYDVIEVGGKLYATAANDEGATCSLVVAPNWRQIVRNGIACTPRLYDAHGQTVALAGNKAGLYLGGSKKPLPFSGFTVNAWNWLAVTPDHYYLVTQDGRVMGSGDLKTWAEVANLNASLASIAYWPAHNSLIVSEMGLSGRLWEVTL